MMDKQRQGWVDTTSIGKFKTISASTTGGYQSENSREILQELSRQIVGQMIAENVITIDTYQNPKDYTVTTRASVTVGEGCPQYFKRVDKIFSVQDNTFDEDELIEAVKNTYPERFI